ncbi:hypothetical protein G1K97_12490 [Tenacibaculum finnmarkense]|uniref:hypothetical protein n=1 Tax=Tenacibaculum finnmarkense TaxID=2781243 RepID=UPI001EFBDB0A|nr:hypothetical protein [Tenacibaculum finnmarkense]MCG8894498.1 hypothetical protein [Tenacibaculum finnmarkense]MCG8902653.1 hypothetical protein [Tenacibaculum finnmarkense]
MSVGIAKIAPRDTNLQADKNLVIISANESLSFTVYVYESTSKADKKAIKWIWVEEKYIAQLRAMTKENKFEHWGKWSLKEKKPLNLYGIGINYAKSTSINVSKLSNSVGKKYWIEAFILCPEFKHPVGKYFTIKGEPSILSSYFEGTAIGECNDLVKSKYGKTINLIINTHSLPDVSLSYHNYVLFEVDIYNKEKNKKVTKVPFRSYVDFAQGAKDLNGTIKMGIILEDSWRTDDEVAHNSGETRSYYAVIKATHYFNKDAVYKGEVIPGTKPGSTFTKPKGAPNGEHVAFTITKEDWEKDNSYLSFLGKPFEDVKAAAAKYQNTVINFKTIDSKDEQLPLYVQLPYTTQGEAIEARSMEVGKMLAAIKDKKYTCKETHPCKFTAIEVMVGKNEDGKKKPVVIFNENDDSTIEVNDNTTKIFSFVAGESKRETLEITLKDLSITDFGNDDGEIKCIAAEPHTIKNIIDASKVSPQWLVEKGSDTDKKYSTYEVEKNTVLLDMGYIFNKSYDNSVLNFLGHEASYLKSNQFGEALKNIWVVRYLIKIAKGESLYQSYFIPIGTCRYPSQLIRMAVYPDMKWVINLNYNISEPLYYNQTSTEMEYHQLSGADDMSGHIKNKREVATGKHISTAYQNQKSKFGLYVECEVGGSSKIKLGKDFAEKFRKMMAPFTWIVDKLDNDLGLSTAKSEQKKLKRSAKKGLLARLNKLPMSFELTAPNIGVGIGI